MTTSKKPRGGPWLSADYNQFAELCLYGSYLRENELLNSPVYQWLKQKVPRAVAMTDDGENPHLRDKRMLIVAQHINMAMRPNATRAAGVLPKAEAARVKKDFRKRIKSIQSLLNAEIITVGLRELLTRELSLLHYRPSKGTHPWLQRLAQALYQETATDDAQLLLEVAKALTFEGALIDDMSDRTAQRYVAAAKTKSRTAP